LPSIAGSGSTHILPGGGPGGGREGGLFSFDLPREAEAPGGDVRWLDFLEEEIAPAAGSNGLHDEYDALHHIHSILLE